MLLILKVPKRKLADFANSIDSDEAAHNEPLYLDLLCLLLVFEFSI